MNFYQYLPHEYSYALYLAYEFDLHPYDSIILNKKYGNAYKLVYCPSHVVQSFKHLCKDVGVFVDEKGNKHLALSDVPLKVKFQQALSKFL
ncbi:miraculin [Trifolium repens]|nr:miraculin [Trifolium repens]